MSAYNFSSMKWDIRGIPLDTLFEKYNDLFQLYSETQSLLADGSPLHPGLSAEQVTALAVYTYHQGSPLISEASMHKRRLEALRLLSFIIIDAKDLQRHSELGPYIVGANPFVNHLAIRFCKFEPNSFEWTELCRKQDMLDDVFLTLKEEQMGTEKKSANEILKIKLEIELKAEGLQNRIRELAKSFFKGDTNLLSLISLNQILEQRKAILTPERYVSQKS
jgi:hypothetical protein